MWREAGLQWKDFLPEDEDVNKFVTEKVRGHSPPSSSSTEDIHYNIKQLLIIYIYRRVKVRTVVVFLCVV